MSNQPLKTTLIYGKERHKTPMTQKVQAPYDLCGYAKVTKIDYRKVKINCIDSEPSAVGSHRSELDGRNSIMMETTNDINTGKQNVSLIIKLKIWLPTKSIKM